MRKSCKKSAGTCLCIYTIVLKSVKRPVLPFGPRRVTKTHDKLRGLLLIGNMKLKVLGLQIVDVKREVLFISGW